MPKAPAKIKLNDEPKASFRKPKKKADKKIKLPKDKKDKTNKNPHLENLNMEEEINKTILKLVEKYGQDYIVITHFVDGTAISIADKAKRKDTKGDQSLPHVKGRKENDYIWVGPREPISSGTVSDGKGNDNGNKGNGNKGNKGNGGGRSRRK